MGRRDASPTSIDRGSPRTLFTELVGEAVAEVRATPSPLASAYLVDLLEQTLRSPDPTGEATPTTLAETLLAALREPRSVRALRLRALGDRVLFSGGFFSARVQRSVVGERYYCEIGAAAYAGLASLLSRSDGAALFGELAERFPVFLAVLSEVGDRSRGESDEDLLALCDRYAQSGSASDRARLARRGITVPVAGRGGWGGGVQ